jgi:small multidrug resistance pump|nr:EamA family transporter [uncultured Acetatifactor sp.]
MNRYILLALLSGVLSSLSQILLKVSAMKNNRGFLAQYFNWRVLAGYGITGTCMLLVIIAYRGMDYKLGAVLEALGYVYIMVWSKIFLKEKITRNKFLGNLLIIVGVTIFAI